MSEFLPGLLSALAAPNGFVSEPHCWCSLDEVHYPSSQTRPKQEDMIKIGLGREHD